MHAAEQVSTPGDTDIARLGAAIDSIDSALVVIDDIASRELDESMPPINMARMNVSAALHDRLRELTAVVARFDTAARLGRTVPAGKVLGQDGKWYPQSRQYMPYTSEQVKSLHATGLSMRAIAEKLGCSVGTVHHHLH